jgi:hypothetical protein
MSSDSRIPRLLGVVFLIVAAASISSFILFESVIGTGSISDSLVNIANKPVQMLISILIELITSFGIVALGVLLFVVLQKQNKNIALIALGWFLAEATILAVSKISAFSLLSLSKEYVGAGSPDSSYFQTLGTLFHGADRSGYNIHMLFFGLGGILFYYLFYISRYIPRLLSAWGLIAIALAFIGTWLVFFDIKIIAMVIPNMAFEIAIGIWLLAKGINYKKT